MLTIKQLRTMKIKTFSLHYYLTSLNGCTKDKNYSERSEYEYLTTETHYTTRIPMARAAILPGFPRFVLV